MSINQRIRDRRLALGLSSHKALAELVGVSWQTVQLWEKEGGTAPNRSRIEKVAEVLGVTTSWLQTGDESTQAGQRRPPKTEVTRAKAPGWMDAEAYRLLELYFSLNERKRGDVFRYIEGLQSEASAAAGSNG